MSIARTPQPGRHATPLRHAGILALVALAACGTPEPDPPPAPVRGSLPVPAELVDGDVDYSFGLALAPDGRRLAFAARRAGHLQLWLRDLRTGDVAPIAHSDGGSLPFWSPDSGTLAFFSGGALRAVTLHPTAVTDLTEAPSPQGGVWLPNGDIVFAPREDAGLFRRFTDGRVEPLTRIDAARERGHGHPQLADRGGRLVYLSRARDGRDALWMVSLAEDAAAQRLTSADGSAIVIGDALLFASGRALVAQRLDFDTGRLAGASTLIGTPVGHGGQQHLLATGSDDVLIFAPPRSALRELVWFDRSGARTGRVGAPMPAWDVRVAPRGSRVAVARVDPQLNTLDLWIYEGDRPLPNRLSRSIDADEAPAWSRDGRRIAWVSGRRTLTLRASDAQQPEIAVAQFEPPLRVTSWSADDRTIVISATRAGKGSDILLQPTDDGDTSAYASTPFNETHGVVSPDGRWLAYASDESGRVELYLDSFPVPRQRARLTLGGATEPRWSADGRELYFRRGSEIHVVRLASNGKTPEALSTARLFDAGADIRSFDVASNGRFLLNLPAPDAASDAPALVVNVHNLLPTPPE